MCDTAHQRIDNFTESEVRDLTRRTQSLFGVLERGDGLAGRDPSETIEAWAEAVSTEGDARLASRLEARDTDVDTVQAALRGETDVNRGPDSGRVTPGGELRDDHAIPEWIASLDELLSELEQSAPSDPSSINPDRDRPFGDVIGEITSIVSRRLFQSPHDFQGYSEQAIDDLREWLGDRIAVVLRQPLFIEFQVFQAEHCDESPRPEVAESRNRPRTKAYRRFVCWLVSGGLKTVLLEYALTGFHLIRAIEQWKSSIYEFAERLSDDRAEICQSFGIATDFEVTSIDVRGDPHENGRRVFVLTVTSDTRIVYKPRSTAPEKSFFAFMEYVNEESDLLTHELPNVLNEGEYGWMKYVEHGECESFEDAERYYRRAGNLIAILHVLDFVDGHVENIIAHGEYPVPVDLETILHPTVETSRNLAKTSSVDEVRSCIARTGLLPMFSPNSDASGISAFGGSRGYLDGVRKVQFENVNSDGMEMSYEHRRFVQGKSLPSVNGEVTDPENFYESIRRGYVEAYDFLRTQKEDLLKTDGPLSHFDGIRVRILCRSTNEYTKSMDLLATPTRLRSGVDFDVQIESLCSQLIDSDIHPSLWNVYRAERKALWSFDVPRFSVYSDETELRFRDQQLCSHFEQSPFDSVRENVENLSSARLQRGLQLLTLAFAPDRLKRPALHGDAQPPRTVEPRDELSLIDEVHAIRERVVEAQYLAGDKKTWISWQSRNEGIYITEIPDDVYEGRLGLAIFAAALDSHSDRDDFATHVETVLQPLLERIRSDKRDETRVGIGHGVGSLIYGLTVVGELLDEQRYVSAAMDVVEQLDVETIREDAVHDVIGGNAGLILALIALYDRNGDSSLIDTAVTAGNALASSASYHDGYLGWYTVEDSHFLPGFAHGNAGIAYALTKLASQSDVERFELVAREALSYEHQLYDSGRNNWPDLRSKTDNEYMQGWCSGLYGNALARLGAHRAIHDPNLRDFAVQTLNRSSYDELVPRDTLCCGNAGRISVLTEVATVTSNETFHRRAEQLAEQMVERRFQQDRYVVPYQTEQRYAPSLFVGEPGIGYALLRVLDPTLPCILLFE